MQKLHCDAREKFTGNNEQFKIRSARITRFIVGVLKEILSNGIGGLYARHSRVYNVFLHRPPLTGQFRRKTDRLRPIQRHYYTILSAMPITYRGLRPKQKIEKRR